MSSTVILMLLIALFAILVIGASMTRPRVTVIKDEKTKDDSDA